MATCIQANPCRPRPSLYASTLSQSSRRQPPRAPPVLAIHGNSSSARPLKLATTAAVHLQFAPLLKHHRRSQQEPAVMDQRRSSSSTPVCLLGGKDKSDKDNEGSPWKSFEKAMGSFKGQSIEDVLRQQIEKQEFYDGGSDKNPPRGGSGGSGGDGSGGSEDEGLSGVMDETLQVILATLGFIFLYIYIIRGEELTLLAKDYIRFLFRGSKSVRLRKTMNKWKRFFKRLAEKKNLGGDKLWLERAIINTPTWFDSPEKYRQILRSHLASKADQ